MNKVFFYSDIHKSIHKLIKSPRFPSDFSLFFLVCALGMLVSAFLIAHASLKGYCDYHFARRLLPMLTEASALTAVLAVGGGALLERLRTERGN